MTDITNPHDRFFKEALSRQEVARDFVAHYLPGDISALLDLDSLMVRKDSFVDKELGEHFSDLLYSVDLKQRGLVYVYLLFEHKSFVERLISFHLLRYMLRIWEQWLKQEKGKNLPAIIPIVLYHGREKWNVSLKFCDLFEAPETLKRFVPDFRYVLWDLSLYSDDKIKGAVTLKAMFLLLKHFFSEDLSERLPEILELLRDLLDRRSGLEYLETILRYVASGTDQIGKQEIDEALKMVLADKGGGIMPSLAEQWIQQGIDQGIDQGIKQGMLQDAREMVLEVVLSRFGMTPEDISRVVKSIDDRDVLRSLLRQAISCENLEAFRKILARRDVHL